jgi:elongation factor Ts
MIHGLRVTGRVEQSLIRRSTSEFYEIGVETVVMAEISAARVKELRERTGAGMMECKRALQETAGDIDAAIELMRKAGLAKADKKAGRVAAEGVIALAPGTATIALVEVNCETDFVAKGDDFKQFAAAVAARVLETAPVDLEALAALPLADGKSVEETRREMIARIGENIGVRRFVRLESSTHVLNGYLHGGRIGAIVELDGGTPELAKDLAMHVAASRPLCIRPDQVPAAVLDKEREIYTAQVAAEGKKEAMIPRIVEGKVKKFLDEVTLLGQKFVKDPEQSVGQLLERSHARVLRFERFELGEGIEKKSGDFVSEVMAQVKGD